MPKNSNGWGKNATIIVICYLTVLGILLYLLTSVFNAMLDRIIGQ